MPPAGYRHVRDPAETPSWNGRRARRSRYARLRSLLDHRNERRTRPAKWAPYWTTDDSAALDHRAGAALDHRDGAALDHRDGAALDHRDGAALDHRDGAALDHR